MDKEKLRIERFSWDTKEELNIYPSQCKDCKNNTYPGTDVCEAFEKKPHKYIANIEKCPKHIKNG